MQVLIIEDEQLAAERLQILLQQYDASIQVAGVLESIEEACRWLKQKPAPDLLLMDIQLSDGHSFEIFKQVHINRPVVFTTAFDQYALDAFKHYGIDYILKPVTAEALAAAIEKWRHLKQSASAPAYQDWATLWQQSNQQRYKDRFLAKVGSRTFFIQTDEVVCFMAENKTVFLADREGNRFVINYNLEALEQLLDPYQFFRINRKYIVHSKYIELIKPYYNSRLKLTLKHIRPEEELIVSRDRVTLFRQWAEG